MELQFDLSWVEALILYWLARLQSAMFHSNAYIPPPKLAEYLLSETHAVGKSKAKFFRSLGFNETNTEVLERQLLAIGQVEPVTKVLSSPYGTKYVVDGLIKTPDGTSVQVRTVWIIEEDKDRPRFVTAYPA